MTIIIAENISNWGTASCGFQQNYRKKQVFHFLNDIHILTPIYVGYMLLYIRRLQLQTLHFHPAERK
jgi:hypothetical protein